MLGSDYRELIVPRLDNKGKASAILIGGGLLTLLLLIFASVFAAVALLLIAAAAGFATWYFWTQERIEYEYIISGDQLEVTKIIAESKRKPMLTVELRAFTAFGQLANAEPLSAGATTVLACTAQDETAFYADFDHSDYGQTRLIFTPNDDILLYLTKHLPRNLSFRWEPQNAN